MLLDESVDDLIKELGHDGTAEWWPEFPVPYNYRGIHLQEIVDLCLKKGKALVPIELYPRTASQKDPLVGRLLWNHKTALQRFGEMIHQQLGILIGEGLKGGHACAWDGHIVFDPNGRTYPITEFKVLECWILHSG